MSCAEENAIFHEGKEIDIMCFHFKIDVIIYEV